GKDLLVIADLFKQLVIFCSQFIDFKTRQFLKSQIKNGLRLNFSKFESGNQIFTSLIHCTRTSDDLDHFIDVVHSNDQPFYDMGSFFSLFQLKLSSSNNDFDSKINKGIDQFFQRKKLRTSPHQSHIIHSV